MLCVCIEVFCVWSVISCIMYSALSLNFALGELRFGKAIIIIIIIVISLFIFIVIVIIIIIIVIHHRKGAYFCFLKLLSIRTESK